MTGVWRGEPFGEQQPRLFARPPGAGVVQFPLLPELRHRHRDPEAFERPHGDHLVVPVVIHGNTLEALWNRVDDSGSGGAMLERETHEGACDLSVPGRANPVLVLGSAHRPRYARSSHLCQAWSRRWSRGQGVDEAETKRHHQQHHCAVSSAPMVRSVVCRHPRDCSADSATARFARLLLAAPESQHGPMRIRRSPCSCRYWQGRRGRTRGQSRDQ